MYTYTPYEIKTNTAGWEARKSFYAERAYMDDKTRSNLYHAQQQCLIWHRRNPTYTQKVNRFYDLIYSRLDPAQKAHLTDGQSVSTCVNPALYQRALFDHTTDAFVSTTSPRDYEWIDYMWLKERK